MEDRELIESYLEGDEKAFEKLYEKYRMAVFNFIYSMVRNEEIANDIFQDVFIKVINGLSDYKDGNFKAWIFQISRNAVMDYLKSAKNKNYALNIPLDEEIDGFSLKDILPSDETPEKKFISEYESKRLYEALDKLSDDYREIIFLKHFSGLTFQEISDAIKVSIGTLLSRFKRAVEKLAEILKE
ncbi:MAG TPA: sigma-70 family RNA polymerase sigma factor [Elusimicrobiales bacterium]|nr:sigma-70 family RNA polymerase sigma factor [Elusimicrobiales bacterium]HPO94709.1 sigma-70 family RNA polymerase sigma factor [Elusimicrobiales bacterium]